MTDRDRLIELFNEINKDPAITCPHYKTDKTCDGCKYTINDVMCNHTLRTVDYLLANGVIVQKQGEWQDNNNGTFTCSVCGGKSSRMKYCGNCGAELKEREGK